MNKLIKKIGPIKWSYIANFLPERVGKQCRERWHHHLSPNINRNKWTDKEEWILFLMHCNKGNKWADISK